MLFPKKVKFRKWHTFREHPSKVGVASRGTHVSFGSFALKATSGRRVTSNQLESARKVLARGAGKTGKVWLRVFPDMPFTKKPAEVKLGKGKGDPAGYHVPIKPGRVVFEIDGVSEEVAREALRKAGTKLPLKTKIISRHI
ncbi:MAG: 50S ribosomal protein L16 [Patescibacteria group bacterium]